MNWLKISLFGLGLAMIVGPGCSDKGSNPPPIILGNGGTSGGGGASGAGGTTGTVDAGSVTAPDGGVDVVAANPGADGGGTCVATKTGHLAIINAPTTGGLDVPGPTPPAYDICK